MFKALFHKDKDKPLPVSRRLAAGACAGMASTVVTYPLDTLRLRLAVDPNLRGMGAACKVLLAEGGVSSFYRGVGTAMIGALALLMTERCYSIATNQLCMLQQGNPSSETPMDHTQCRCNWMLHIS